MAFHSELLVLKLVLNLKNVVCGHYRKVGLLSLERPGCVLVCVRVSVRG